MNNIYGQSTYEVTNSVISIGKWELLLYLVLAFVFGFLIHYIFSNRRDYVRAPKSHRYYTNTEPIFPPRY